MRKLLALLVVGVIAALLVVIPGSAGAGPKHCGNSTHSAWSINASNGVVMAVGTEGDDVFHAWRVDHDRNLVIVGLGGDDIICGSQGSDVIYGGEGDDIIVARRGHDIVSGGPGNDWIRGGPGHDELHGDEGDDRIRGGRGADTLIGGDGDDQIRSSKRDKVDQGGGAEPAPPPDDKTKDDTGKNDGDTGKDKDGAGKDNGDTGKNDGDNGDTGKDKGGDGNPVPPPAPPADPPSEPTPPAQPPSDPPSDPTPDPTPPPPPPPPSAPTGQFDLNGRHIIDPNGDVFIPIGANVGPPLRDTNGNCVWWLSLRCSDITGRLASVQAWNWNTLRVNILCQAQDLGGGVQYGPDQMFDAIDRMIDEYTQAGIVLMFDCHDPTGVNPPIGGQMWNDMVAFWQRFVTRYGDNPYVWINFANEFESQLDGQVYFRQFTEAAYQAITATGFEGIMVMDLPQWAQHIQYFENPANRTWAEQFDQVVWGWHAYGGISEDGTIEGVRRGTSYADMAPIYDRIVDMIIDNDIPVVVGEFGYDWNASRQIDGGWDWDSMRHSARHNIERLYDAGIGMTIWHANGSSGVAMHYGVKASDDLTFDEPTVNSNLSEVGQLYWDLTRRVN